MRVLLIILSCCVFPMAALAAGSSTLLAQADTPLPVPGAPEAGEPAPQQQPPAEPGTDDGAGTGEDLTAPDPGQPDQMDGEDTSPDDLSLGEIPVIETMELTTDIAKRALDIYVLVKTKYENSDLESYENLQDFVDQNAEGKSFEADIKAAGFANVNDWNLAITTVTFAYTSVTDDPTEDIKSQIAEIEADTELAQDMKDRMITSLKAMIPSENNKRVIAELMTDSAYLDKLKQLDVEEE